MKILCDRCKREVEAQNAVMDVLPSVGEVNVPGLPSVPVAEYQYLPLIGGVYFGLVGDVVTYIGESGNFNQRWGNHHILPRLLAQVSGRIAWIPISDKQRRREFEREAIRHFKPLWNRGGRCYLDWHCSRYLYPSLRRSDVRNRADGAPYREFMHRLMDQLLPATQQAI